MKQIELVVQAIRFPYFPLIPAVQIATWFKTGLSGKTAYPCVRVLSKTCRIVERLQYTYLRVSMIATSNMQLYLDTFALI